MRSTLLLALALIASLALVSTAAAETEDFQNGPGMVSTYDGSTPGGPVPLRAYPYDDTFGPDTNFFGFYPGSTSNLFSATPITQLSPTSDLGTVLNHEVKIFDAAGTQQYYAANGPYVRNNGTTSYYNPVRILMQRSDNVLNFYANGVLYAQAALSAVPYYWTLNADEDDIIQGAQPAGVVGTIPHTWYVLNDIETSLSGLYTETGDDVYNTYFHASYAINGDPAGATISIDGDHQVQTLGIETLDIKDKDGVWHDGIPIRSGVVTFNLTEFIATHPSDYGRHTIVLETAGGTVSSEFWYTGASTVETGIDFDRDVYAPLDSVEITANITDDIYNAGAYSFKGCIYDSTTGLYKENWTIATQQSAHSTAVTTDLFPASGEYYAMLYAVEASSGAEILLDVDSAEVWANKVVVSGTVWDAQQGTILSGATVSLTQSGTALTATTGSDGRFEFVNLAKDTLTQVSAAKSGFITSWSNWTPTEYQRYEIEIALSPSAPAHTGEAVFGTVRSYPLGSFVASPAVAILKDGVEIESMTGTAKGFYIFDGLNASTTYTVEVEMDGFVPYSNAVVTGSGGSSLTQMDPWLIPYYELTVYLVDAVSMDPITALMAVSIGGQSEQTTTGTVTFDNVQMGAGSVAVVGSGYEANETAITMQEDQEITLYIMPLAVVPTTNIPLTPTPTPAIVNMIGTVYDGMTGQPITTATVDVSAAQGDVTRTDATDGNGDYDIQNIQNGVLTTVNATAAGYTHTAFSFTPVGSAEYIVDLYMYRTDELTNPTIEPDEGLAGAGGTVLGGPFHELVESPTVTANNGTWSGPATLSPDHVWYFTNLEPGTAYNFTASASGYVTRTVEATMGGANSFTVVPIVLDGVYNVKIEIHDADSYTLILQTVQLTLSDGQTGNTSVGSYTFTNLGYATYVVSATSEGYTGGGLSFIAYGDHTEYLYLSKLPAGGSSSIDYSIPPKHVELVARSIFGAPLSGVAVSVQGQSTTLPDPGLLDAIFGWTDDYSNTNLANATMTGTTGPDGAVSFLLTDTVKYLVTFSDPTRGISQTTELYPHDTQYIYVLGSAGATPAATMPNMTLWAEDAGATTTLYGYYSDQAGTTTALRFVVELQNGTVLTEVLNQSYAGQQTVTASHAVNHTTGDQYVWGWRATTPERGDLEQWSGTTLHSRLIDLEIEDHWYFWISAAFLFIFAGLFSGMTSRFGFILLPLFALLLWYIGWLDTSIATLGIAMIAGVLMYISRVQVG